MSVDAIHRGLDTQAAAAAFAPIADFELRNHDGVDIATDPEMTAFSSRCQQALKRAIWEEQHALSPYLYADPLDGVQLGETSPRVMQRLADASNGSLGASDHGFAKPHLSRSQHCWERINGID